MARNILREAVTDFIFQDTSLMDYLFLNVPLYSRTELITRLLIFFLLIPVLWSVFRPGGIIEVTGIIFLSHFLNWFFNGHGYQILFSILSMRFSSEKAVGYVLRLKGEAERRGLHVMVYGSWASGRATSRSDIDIFVLNVDSKSVLNSLKLGLLTTKYRILALFNMLSVDIYVIDRAEYLLWRRERKPEERPVVINDPSGLIRNIYNGKITPLKIFLGELRKLYA